MKLTTVIGIAIWLGVAICVLGRCLMEVCNVQ